MFVRVRVRARAHTSNAHIPQTWHVCTRHTRTTLGYDNRMRRSLWLCCVTSYGKRARKVQSRSARSSSTRQVACLAAGRPRASLPRPSRHACQQCRNREEQGIGHTVTSAPKTRQGNERVRPKDRGTGSSSRRRDNVDNGGNAEPSGQNHHQAAGGGGCAAGRVRLPSLPWSSSAAATVGMGRGVFHALRSQAHWPARPRGRCRCRQAHTRRGSAGLLNTRRSTVEVTQADPHQA